MVRCIAISKSTKKRCKRDASKGKKCASHSKSVPKSKAKRKIASKTKKQRGG